MQNVLFIVGSYFPSFSAVGKCQYYLADEMVKRGYKIYVIAITHDSNFKEKEVYNGQTIHRIYIKKMDKIRTLINRSIKRLSFDILDRELSNRYLKSFNELDVIPDLIIPTCLPFESIYAAIEYKKIHSKCKVIPCLYDKFADSNVLYKWKLEKYIKRNRSILIEQKVLKDCDGILYTKSWQEYLMSYHDSLLCKCECIEHPLIVNITDEKSNRIVADKRLSNAKVVFAGMLIQNYVDASYFLQCVEYIKSDRIEFAFYSQGTGIEELEGNDVRIKNYGWIPFAELLDIIAEADVLLSISERKGIQISSKIFEYMSIGKPIIHIYYVDDDINLSYLRQYPLALCVKADMKRIEMNAQIIERWITQNIGKVIDFKYVQSIFRSSTPSYICDQMMHISRTDHTH